MIKIKIVAGNQTHNLFWMISAFFAAEINVPSDGVVNGKPKPK